PRPRLAGRRDARGLRAAPRRPDHRAVHDRHDHRPRGRGAPPGREWMMGDLALYRRLARHARPFWIHILALLALGLLASPLALLAPLPIKIVVDSVLGARPLPTFVTAGLPTGWTRTPAAVLLVAIGLLLAVVALTALQNLASTLLRAWVGERLVLDFRSRLVDRIQRLSPSYHETRG